MGRFNDVILLSLFVAVFVFVLFFFSFSFIESKDDFRDKTSQAMTGNAVHPVYKGFALPVSGFPAVNDMTFSSSALKAISFSVNDSVVYKYAYISINGSAWTRVSMAGSNPSGSWLLNSASGNYSISSSAVSVGSNERNFIAVYSCSRSGSSWDCHDGWQLRTFKTTKTLVHNSNSSGQNSSNPNNDYNTSPINLTSSAKVVGVWASGYEVGSVNYPSKTLDGVLLSDSRWSSFGDGEWIVYALNQTASVSYVRLVFYSTDYRTYFDVQYSIDNVTWRNTSAFGVYGVPASQGVYQRFNFTPVNAKYVRIVGHGRSDPTLWNSIVEVDINGFGVSMVSGGMPLTGTINSTSTCTQNVSSRCFTDGDVYWYDSCDVKGARRYDCSSSQICLSGACVSSSGSSGVHPFLLANANDLAAIRAKVAISGSKSKTAFENLRTQSTNIAVHNMGDNDYAEYVLVESALKYAVSGDTVAANNAIATIDSVMARVGNPANFQPSRTDRMYDDYNLGWSVAVAYDLLYPYMSTSKRAEVKSWLEGMADFYWRNLEGTENNFYSGSWASLGMISLTLYYDTSNTNIKTTYLDAAVYRTNRLFNTQAGEVSFEPDGTYPEGTGYITYGGDAEYLFAYSYEKVTGKKLLTAGQAFNISNFYGYAHTADGGMPNYGDNTQKPGNPGPGNYFYTYRMAPFALVPNAVARSSVWRFFWDLSNPSLTNIYGYYPNFFVVLFYPEDISSKSPRDARLPDSYFFRDASLLGGNLALRSGWNGNDEITVWFTNKYDFIGHGHFDPNSFSFSAYGDRFVDDENGDDYGSEKHGYIMEHNTIVVDDVQLPLKAKYFSSAVFGRIIGFSSGSGGTVARGDAKYPYADPSNNTATSSKSRSSIEFYSTYLNSVMESQVTPFQKGDRTVAMINSQSAPAYFVTIDNVRKDNSVHKYQWQIHTYKSIQGEGTTNLPYVLDGTNADLYIYFIQPESFTGNVGKFYSQTAESNHNLLTVAQSSVVEGHFFTIYYPRKSGMELPTITTSSLSNGVVAAVSWSDYRVDYLMEKRSGTVMTMQSISSDGKFTAVRTTGQGAIVDSILLEEGNSLTYRSKVMVQVTGSTSASASSSRTGKIASINGQGITSASIYAPAADTLLLNGKSVSFTRDGDLIKYN